MIILDNLGRFQLGRIWINDVPEIKYKEINKLTSAVEVKEIINMEPCRMALELLLSRRDISNYAFIGVKYIPNKEKNLNISVYVSEDEGEILDDNIAMKSDNVFIGIPNEYAETVLSTANKVIEGLPQFSSGDLEFYIGAHGEVGSSKLSFSKVTELIIKLLVIEREGIKSLNQIEELISNESLV